MRITRNTLAATTSAALLAASYQPRPRPQILFRCFWGKHDTDDVQIVIPALPYGMSGNVRVPDEPERHGERFYSLADTARATGIDERDLVRFYQMFVEDVLECPENGTAFHRMQPA